MKEQVPLKALLSLIERAADPERLRRARLRQTQAWLHQEPDSLPLLVAGPVPERAGYPAYDLREQFHDPARMLYEQLWPALATLRGRGDGIPSVRVNFGTGFLVSVFGLRQEVFPDKMPWLREHLSREALGRWTVKDLEPVSEKGLLPECRRYLSFYRDTLADLPVSLYLPDTQGPFDLAHLAAGDRLFTDIYDDPGFVDHLLALTTRLYSRASAVIKPWLGETLNAGHHGCNLYMADGGVRVCEDTTTLLSPSFFPGYLPFLQEALSPFGGGWVHFCGRAEHLLDALLTREEVRGINFGNPESYDWPTVIRMINEQGKVYYGRVARKKDEALPDYFRRVLAPLRRKTGLILIPDSREEETPELLLSHWRRAQAERWG